MSTPRRSDRKRTAATFFTDTSSLTTTPLKKQRPTPPSISQRKASSKKSTPQVRAKAKVRGGAKKFSIAPLDGFFQALQIRHHFVARQNFACCRSCGMYEISMERKGSLRNAHASVFYHMQDTSSAAVTGNLMLRWAPFDEDEYPWVKVSDAILEEAERFGLDVSWNGSTSSCIQLVGLDVKPFRRMEKKNAKGGRDLDH